jgi:hypothetical protein
MIVAESAGYYKSFWKLMFGSTAGEHIFIYLSSTKTRRSGSGGFCYEVFPTLGDP